MEYLEGRINKLKSSVHEHQGKNIWESIGQFSPDLPFLFCIYWTPTHHCRNELIDWFSKCAIQNATFYGAAPTWAEIILLVNFPLEDHRCSCCLNCASMIWKLAERQRKWISHPAMNVAKKKKCNSSITQAFWKKKITLAVSIIEPIYCHWEYWLAIF